VTDTKPSSPTRRRLLIAGSAVAAAGATGALWIGSRLDGRQTWIEAVVREHLTGITLEPASLASFAANFAESRIFADEKSKLAVNIDQAVPAIAQRVSKVSRRTEQLKRRIVTEYLMGTNFFRVADPRAETIIYSGSVPACGNPFAVFRDA
jgi:hypothetical protein